MRQFFLILAVLAASVASSSNTVAQECVCKTCRDASAQRGPEWDRYWEKFRQAARDRAPNVLPPSNFGSSQIVFLDFDSGKDSSFVYTQTQRDEIQSNMESIYAGFDVAFTQTLPSGDFSMVVFNAGGAGGLAEDIDFRNLNKADNAILNADGLGLDSQQIVTFSSNVASHELGHLLGLRHADSFGPIGEGVLPPFGTFFNPPYPGPQVASESFNHIMATPGLGAPLSVFFDSLNFFAERSSAKIGFAEDGLAVDDLENNDTIGSAQAITLQSLAVPNQIQIGKNAGAGPLSFSATVVAASLNAGIDGVDIFRVEARSGDIFTIEVISNSVDRLALDPIDPNISAFDINGNFIDYYGEDPFNENEFESSLDCNLVDLVIQNDGPFFLQVDNTFPTDSGQYELWVYRFNGIQGDVNCDGVVNLLDVAPFVAAIQSGDGSPKADINVDGAVNLLDVSPFVDLLSGN